MRWKKLKFTDTAAIEILKLEDFARFGKPAKIAKLFGGKSGYEAAINELEMEMYQEDEVS